MGHISVNPVKSYNYGSIFILEIANVDFKSKLKLGIEL